MTKYLILTLFIFITACGGKKSTSLHEEIVRLSSLAKNENITANDAIMLGEKALLLSQQITEEGEKDFVFEAYDESLEIFKIATELDAKNIKAKLYVSLLEPLVYLKGLQWKLGALNSYSDSERLELWFLNNYSDPGGSISPFLLFLSQKNGERIKSLKQLQDEITIPVSKILLRSSNVMREILDQNQNIDLTLTLPNIFSINLLVRARNADVELLQKYYLGMAYYARLFGLYRFSSKPFDRAMIFTAESFYNLADPQFGILQDPDFFISIKKDSFEIVEGLDYTFAKLHDRVQKADNHSKDMFQLSYLDYLNCDLALGCENIDNKKLFLTTIGSNDRQEFWSQDGNIQKPKSSIYNENHAHSYKNRVDELAIFKSMLLGPYEVVKQCWSSKDYSSEQIQKIKNLGIPKQVKYWINIPNYLNNSPSKLQDLVFNNKGILELKDKTFAGLFSPAFVDCPKIPDWIKVDHKQVTDGI